MRFRLMWICIPLLAGLVPRAAGGSELRAVTVTGEAAIIDGDELAARRQALMDARVQALEQAAGVFVDAQTVIDSELFTASSLRVKARGAITRETVVGEAVEGGLYRVTLRASVSEERLADELVRLVEQDRVVVALSLSGSVGEDAASRIRAGLAGALRDQGYQHVVEAEKSFPEDSEQARKLGLRFLADAVLAVATQLEPAARQPGGLWSCRARGQARVFRTASREIVADIVVAEARGFGDSAAAARRAALEAFTRKSSEELAARLLPEELRTVRVEVLDIPDYASFERVRSLLAAQRWTQEVKTDPVGYHRRSTVFFVRTRLMPVDLGAALDRDAMLSVERSGSSGLRIQFEK